jgi:TP901 family phage tail tape measure protein
MSENQTNWILTLVDNFTKPLSDITESLKKIEVNTEFANTSLDGLQKSFTALNSKLGIAEPELEQINSELKKTDLNADNAKKSVGDLGGKFENLGKKSLHLNQISQAMQSLNEAFVDMTKPAVDFDSTMKDLQAITGVTGDTFTQIGDGARDLAKEFGGNAANSVETFKLMLSKLSPELAKTPDVLQGMAENAQLLSKTMKGDVIGATEVLSAGMNQFQVDMSNPTEALKEMTKQMNVMSAGAKFGAVELPQLKESIEGVGALAKDSGMSFEQLNSAIQNLSPYGYEAAEAGTALKSILNQLSKGRFLPKDVQKELKSAGVDVNMLTDKTVSFTDKMRALKNLDTAALNAMFGEFSLAAMGMIKTADAQDELTKKITGTNVTAEQAEIIMGSLSERTSRLRANYDDLKISLGELTGDFVPYATIIGENLVTVSQMAPALTLLKDGFTGLGSQVMKLIPKQWALNASMLANPIGAVAAAIAVLIAEIALVWIYFDEIEAWFSNMPGIVKILVVAWTALTAPILGLVVLIKKIPWAEVGEWFKKVGQNIKMIWQDIKNDAVAFINAIKELFKGLANFVIEYNPFALLLKALDMIFPGIKAKIAEVFTAVKETLIDPIANALENMFGWLFTSGDKKSTKPNPPTKTEGNIIEENIKITQEEKEANDMLTKSLSITKPLNNDNKTNTNTIGGTSNSGNRTLNQTVDVKNYFNISPENMDNFVRKVKDIVTDVLVSATRDAVITAGA